MALDGIDPCALYDLRIVCDPALPAPKMPPCSDCGREQSGVLTLWDETDPKNPRMIDMGLACVYCAMEDSY